MSSLIFVDSRQRGGCHLLCGRWCGPAKVQTESFDAPRMRNSYECEENELNESSKVHPKSTKIKIRRKKFIKYVKAKDMHRSIGAFIFYITSKNMHVNFNVVL
jgi:hypothetical protein